MNWGMPLGDSSDEPLTRLGEGIPSRYTEAYLLAIRSNDKPRDSNEQNTA